MQMMQQFGQYGQMHAMQHNMVTTQTTVQQTIVQRPQNAINGVQKMAGYTIGWASEQAQFDSIRGSGHLAPLNRPRVTDSMLHAFTRKREFPPYAPPHAEEL